jgi:hypothetical protein
MKMDIESPIYKIVGIVVLFLIYVALYPLLVSAITSLAAIAGLGSFSIIIGQILPIIAGAVLLIVAIKKIMALSKD